MFTQQEYDEFRKFLADASGIMLGDNKQYLINSRLSPLMEQNSFATLADLLKQLTKYSNRALRASVIDAMTTNETQWFRDQYPFECLRNTILPGMLEQGTKSLRIWSAACSSGQEPYSISMIIHEYNRQNPRRAINMDVVATDISSDILHSASEAKYPEVAIRRGLTEHRLQQFFRQTGNNQWEVRPEIRRGITFKELNLMETFGHMGKFDIIFCRNVLIYFTCEVRAQILPRMASLLNPGGYLILGASESLARYSNAFEMKRYGTGAVYKLRSSI